MRPSWPPPRMPITLPGGSITSRPSDRRDARPGFRRPPRSGAARQAASAAAIASSLSARIAAASSAALIAPARPIASVPTGTPAGICTIESRLSSALERAALDRHAEHRQRRHRRDHAGQVRRAAGAGDDHLEAARLGARRRSARAAPACGAPRRCASRYGTPSALERAGGVPQGRPVGLAAHDQADPGAAGCHGRHHGRRPGGSQRMCRLAPALLAAGPAGCNPLRPGAARRDLARYARSAPARRRPTDHSPRCRRAACKARLKVETENQGRELSP